MTLATEIRDILEADDALNGDDPLLPGGIYAQPLVPPEVVPDGDPANDETAASEYGYLVTPRAFNADVPLQAVRCATITVQPPQVGDTNWPEMRTTIVDIDLYGPENTQADADEEQKLARAKRVVESVLNRRYVPVPIDDEDTDPDGCILNVQEPLGIDVEPEPQLVWSVRARTRILAVWY